MSLHSAAQSSVVTSDSVTFRQTRRPGIVRFMHCLVTRYRNQQHTVVDSFIQPDKAETSYARINPYANNTRAADATDR
jgi:hypothetical protein